MHILPTPGRRHRLLPGLLVLLALGVALLCASGPSAAQVLPLAPPDATGEDRPSDGGDPLAPLIEAAEKEGFRVIVVGAAPVAPPDDASGSTPIFDLANFVESAELRADLMVSSARRELQRLPARLGRLWPDRPFWGPAWALIAAAAALAVGRLAEIGLRRALLRPRPPVPTEASRGDRYAEILRQLAESLFGVFVMIGVATLIFVIAFPAGSPERMLGHAVILVGAIYVRVGTSLANIAVRCAERPPQIAVFDRREAARLRRGLIAIAAAVGTAAALLHLLTDIGVGENLLRAGRVPVSLPVIGLMLWVLWSNKDAITNAAFREPHGVLARAWPVAGTLYLVIAAGWIVLRAIGDGGSAEGVVLGPLYAAVVALVVYALVVIVAERWLLGHGQTAAAPPAERPGPDPSSTPATEPAVSAGPPDPEAVGGPADGIAAERPEPAPGNLLDVARAIAALVAIAVWVAEVLAGWGVPLLNDAGQVHSVWVILVIVVMARAGWVMLRAFFDRRIAEERALLDPDEPGDEGGGAKGSRLGTLLPLFRTAVLIAVATLAAMIVLSELGVDIAPLFAGAGLIGFAIGFGAQALVRDIFAGLFFLIDDAFRVGEYVEVGALRGTVEKISIRSMQLRHHTGPVHTIPFGEIRELTNFSRDWVIMKLPLRVTFDTDPEKVRKLVKKLGQELAEDPIHGPKFLQPLKSQGVREIDDSGQVIRVKFMTRPGEQFVLRKMVYARIRELFQREGIEFARREVRVRVSGGEDLTDAQREEVAAAAAEGTFDPAAGRA